MAIDTQALSKAHDAAMAAVLGVDDLVIAPYLAETVEAMMFIVHKGRQTFYPHMVRFKYKDRHFRAIIPPEVRPTKVGIWPFKYTWWVEDHKKLNDALIAVVDEVKESVDAGDTK